VKINEGIPLIPIVIVDMKITINPNIYRSIFNTSQKYYNPLKDKGCLAYRPPVVTYGVYLCGSFGRYLYIYYPTDDSIYVETAYCLKP
jgi:hypothetical protein